MALLAAFGRLFNLRLDVVVMLSVIDAGDGVGGKIEDVDRHKIRVANLTVRIPDPASVSRFVPAALSRPAPE